ncbi:hypothetical protein BMF94_2289 [Rhodotorula taiwanensis]|uniref:2-methoxy-6-polyprenyl-1,4-benzoquinol methylase, mitochondrial n=1 Tax=Rhodotorula taiwanensis TaxID=741276 RepID=A0A2S5BCM6_9BASI|nr:hypothetical protein BMF94_2289 [Rhodotorula taiwanensis]
MIGHRAASLATRQSLTRSLSRSAPRFTHPTNPLDPNPTPTPTATPTPTSTATATGTAPRTDSTTHFGFRDVPEQQKENLGETSLLPEIDADSTHSLTHSHPGGTVRGVFSSVASSYDVMNDAMSFGIHRLWKDHYVSKLDPSGGLKCLDVAGGTGDIAMRILDHARTKHGDRETSVAMLDINPEMLQEGKKRFAQTMYHNTPQVSFHLGNAEHLSDFADNTFDQYTIAFGIRNCTHVDRVLKEAHRVLKPGGVFSCLEFSHVENPILANHFASHSHEHCHLLAWYGRAYDLWSFQVIPPLGHILASDRDSYQYLVESIRRFPRAQRFADMIREAGFTVPREEQWEPLTFGVACIHTGVKV